MQQLFQNPAQGRKLGEQGRHLIKAQYSIQALSARYKKRLTELGFRPTVASVVRGQTL